MTTRTSRLAPSPTGALHLGNARTFLVNWALARREGWRLVLRIEDLDSPRVKPGAARQALADLAWLGIDHDGPALVQSEDLAPYRAALERLERRDLVYACALTRREIEGAASAPHPEEERRGAEPGEDSEPEGDRTNRRFRGGAGPIVVADRFAGRRAFDRATDVGDFVVWTKRDVPAYQLAVVVDDARQGVTDVLRGDDLLASAARQSLLGAALGLPEPAWWHLPLVVGADGRRLAKRHGDSRIAAYRDAGVPPDRVIGLLAWWCGIGEDRRPTSAAAFREGLDLARLSRERIVFTEEDHRWLLDAR